MKIIFFFSRINILRCWEHHGGDRGEVTSTLFKQIEYNAFLTKLRRGALLNWDQFARLI